MASWPCACASVASNGRGSIWAEKVAFFRRIWPSVKPTCINLPEICVLIVTVASGVTVPSASMVIGMSPVTAFSGAHGLRRAGLSALARRRRPGRRGADLFVIELRPRSQRDRDPQDEDADPGQPIARLGAGGGSGGVTVGEEGAGNGARRASAMPSRLTVSFIRQSPGGASASPPGEAPALLVVSAYDEPVHIGVK